ncbi:hypothetical protein HDV57DRAFT_491599 [Trichoderma longibrachiatum]
MAIARGFVSLIGTMNMTLATVGVSWYDYRTSGLSLMFHGVASVDAQASYEEPELTREIRAEANTHVKP